MGPDNQGGSVLLSYTWSARPDCIPYWCVYLIFLWANPLYWTDKEFADNMFIEIVLLTPNLNGNMCSSTYAFTDAHILFLSKIFYLLLGAKFLQNRRNSTVVKKTNWLRAILINTTNENDKYLYLLSRNISKILKTLYQRYIKVNECVRKSIFISMNVHIAGQT